MMAHPTPPYPHDPDQGSEFSSVGPLSQTLKGSGKSSVSNLFGASGYAHLSPEDSEDIAGANFDAEQQTPSPGALGISSGVFPGSRATYSDVHNQHARLASPYFGSSSETTSPGSNTHLLGSPGVFPSPPGAPVGPEAGKLGPIQRLLRWGRNKTGTNVQDAQKSTGDIDEHAFHEKYSEFLIYFVRFLLLNPSESN
jgi:hypothetical protein